MNKWKLWLDDQSYDKDAVDRHPPSGWIAAINSSQALALVMEFGLPSEIDFDHDLGSNDDAMIFLNSLRFILELNEIEPPKYKVHSANPIGCKNIISFMESWGKVFKHVY